MNKNNNIFNDIIFLIKRFIETGFYLITCAITFMLLQTVDQLDRINLAIATLAAIFLTVVFFILLVLTKDNYYLSNYFSIFSSCIFCLNLKFLEEMPSESFDPIMQIVLATTASFLSTSLFLFSLRKVTKDKYIIDQSIHLYCLSISASVMIDINIIYFLIALAINNLIIIISPWIFNFQHNIIENKLKLDLKQNPGSLLSRTLTINYIIDLKLYQWFFEKEDRHNAFFLLSLGFLVPFIMIICSKFSLIPCAFFYSWNLKRVNVLSSYNHIVKNPGILNLLEEHLFFAGSGWRRLGGRIINHSREATHKLPGVPGGSGNKAGTAVAAAGVAVTAFGGYKAYGLAVEANAISAQANAISAQTNVINEKLLQAQLEGNETNRKLLELQLRNSNHQIQDDIIDNID